MRAVVPGDALISGDHTLTVLLTSVMATLIVRVPGGLGVLETVFVALLGYRVPQGQLLAALLAYRGIYYLLPLVLATALTGLAAPAHAQGLTREQVKMDRDSFLALMRWDELTGMWVLVENDATVAAIGERLYGVGRVAGSFFYLHFNLGVGGGVVVDGQHYRGAQGGHRSGPHGQSYRSGWPRAPAHRVGEYR